jgi:aarF domain-containing kinase
MAGRRLLDVAALFNASRGVAQKHVALRRQQFDVFTRTSSLAKAVRAQADGYAETLKAASILASKLNSDKPEWTKEAEPEPAPRKAEEPIPSEESVKPGDAPTIATTKDGLKSDHFYEPSEANSSVDAVPKDSLDVRQEKADRYPLPDGTIPPKESKLGTPEVNADTTSQRTAQVPTEPIVKECKTEELHPKTSAKSTIPIPHQHGLTPQEARALQLEYEKQLPSHVADGAEGHAGDKIVKGFDDDSFYHASTHTAPVTSSLPRAKIPKHVSDIEADDSHLDTKGMKPDTFTSPVPADEEVPEGVNTAIFASPRIAKHLGGRSHLKPAQAPPSQPKPTTTEQVRSTATAESIVSPANADEDIKALGSEVS